MPHEALLFGANDTPQFLNSRIAVFDSLPSVESLGNSAISSLRMNAYSQLQVLGGRLVERES